MFICVHLQNCVCYFNCWCISLCEMLYMHKYYIWVFFFTCWFLFSLGSAIKFLQLQELSTITAAGLKYGDYEIFCRSYGGTTFLKVHMGDGAQNLVICSTSNIHVNTSARCAMRGTRNCSRVRGLAVKNLLTFEVGHENLYHNETFQPTSQGCYC